MYLNVITLDKRERVTLIASGCVYDPHSFKKKKCCFFSYHQLLKVWSGISEEWEKDIGSGRNLVDVCPIAKYYTFTNWTLTMAMSKYAHAEIRAGENTVLLVATHL